MAVAFAAGNSTAIQEMFKRVAEYFTLVHGRRRRPGSAKDHVYEELTHALTLALQPTHLEVHGSLEVG